MEVWKMIFLSKRVICRFHVDLPGCTHHFSREILCETCHLRAGLTFQDASGNWKSRFSTKSTKMWASIWCTESATRWWFQTIFWNVHPILGETIIFFRFQMGWFNHQQDNREQWEFPCFWIFDYQETLTREEQTRIQQPRPDSKRQEKVDLKRKPWDFWLQSGYSRGIEKQNTTLEKITVLSPRTLRQHRCKIIQPKNKRLSINKLDWDMIRYLYIRYLEVYCFGHQHTKFIENMKKSQTKLRSHPILGVLT